jgi:hypothetical protein
MGAAVEIYGEFLAADGWEVEGERCIVGLAVVMHNPG